MGENEFTRSYCFSIKVPAGLADKKIKLVSIHRGARRERRQNRNQGWEGDHSVVNVVPFIQSSLHRNSAIPASPADPSQKVFLAEEDDESNKTDFLTSRGDGCPH